MTDRRKLVSKGSEEERTVGFGARRAFYMKEARESCLLDDMEEPLMGTAGH